MSDAAEPAAAPAARAVSPDAPFLSVAFRTHRLCTRCGSCVGCCPTQAIETDADAYPRLLAERCIACGLCGKVCPGGEVRYAALAQQVFGAAPADADFDGQVARTWVGHATDDTLRQGGAGGGIATALLAHLLRSGAVDGCLVTRMRADRPWEGEAFIATSLEALRESQGSRYHVIPMNALWRHLREAGSGRYAAALLPCQMHGYRNLQHHDPALAARLTHAVGLFCGGSLERCLPTELMAVRGIRREALRDFQFRGGEWPGCMRAVLKDGRTRPLHYSNYKDGAYNYFTALYMPERCQTCLDGSNEFADLSVSDAWTRDERGEYKFKAQSRILARTPRGEALLSEAVAVGAIAVQDVSADAHYRTHRGQTRRKGALAPLRIARWRRAGRPTPETDRGPPADATWKERLVERLASATLRAGRWRPFRMALMGFLTSRYAIPLIKLRVALKKRKYARRG